MISSLNARDGRLTRSDVFWFNRRRVMPTSSSQNPADTSRERVLNGYPSGKRFYDAFISYSRRDKTFAAMLEKALNAYVPPRGLELPSRHLEAFRDESDLTGVEYHEAIQTHLERASKLIVICSPHARASEYVGEEIRRFVEAKGAANVIPVLLSGRPNNEVSPGKEAEMAFPQALVSATAMPLAVNYSGFDPARNRVAKGAFYGAWCMLIANLFGVARGEIERRETRRRARRLRAVIAMSVAVGAALCIALVVTLLSRNEATRQRDRALNAIGRIFTERAWQQLDRGDRFLGAKYALAGWRLAASTETDQRLVLASILQGTAELLAVLRHPAHPISAFFGGPDGDLIVTTSEDGEVRLWHWPSGKQVREFTSHELKTNWAVFDPQGKTVVSTSDDSTARVWDAASAQDLFAPLDHPRPVVRASFSPDGRQIVTVSRMQAVAGESEGLHLWNASDGKLIWTASPKAAVLAVDFTRNGDGLVDVVEDGTAEFRERRSGVLRSSRKFGEGTPTAAALNAAQDLLVLVHGNAATAFRLGTGQKVTEFPSGGGDIVAIAIAPSGLTVAAGGEEGIVRIWSVATGYLIAEQVGHEGKIVHVAFSADGSRIVTVSSDATVRVWKASHTVAEFGLRGNAAVAFSGTGSRLAIASATKLEVVEVPSFRVIAQRNIPEVEKSREQDIFATSFLPDANWVLTASSTGEITSHGLSVGVDNVVYRAGPLFAAAIAPGGRSAAVVPLDDPTKVELVDIGTGEVFVLPGGPVGVVSGLRFSADGSRLAAGAQDGSVKVWDTASRKPIMTIEGERSPSGMVFIKVDGGLLRGVALSHEGTLLAYVLSNGTAHIRDVGTNREVAVLQGAEGAESIAFTRDSRLLVTGGGGGVTVWDVRTGRWLAAFGKPSRDIAFGPDGRFVVAGGGSFFSRQNGNVSRFDSATEVWDVARVMQPMPELAQATCTTFLAPYMRRFSDIELAADPLVREVWDGRSAGEQSVCPAEH